MIYRTSAILFLAAAMATPAMAQVCAPVTSSAGSLATVSSSPVRSSSSPATSSSTGFSSVSARFGRSTSKSPMATSALTGFESFTTPFGRSGYQSTVARQQAAFYRFPLIQKSADINVRIANRQRIEEIRRLKRDSRLARPPQESQKPDVVYPRLAYNP